MKQRNSHKKEETSTHDKVSGVSGEQSELFDLPTFSPTLPQSGTDAMQALVDLTTRPRLMQIDWLKEGKSWRLAAEIFVLNELGWDVTSARKPGTRQAVYMLTQKARQAAYTLLKGGESC